MREVAVKLEPHEVKTLMVLTLEKRWKAAKEIEKGKVKKAFIPALENLIGELTEIYLKLANQSKGRW